MARQGFNYNVDIVMCIDCTSSMGEFLDTIKVNIHHFYSDLKERFEFRGKDIPQLRIRIIAFRDFRADGKNALMDSGFLNIPEQEDQLNAFVNGLEPLGGGDEPENGLEALAMAINSDWTKGGDKRRHIIVVCSDASTHPINTIGRDNPLYPQNMPATFEELTEWWDGVEKSKINRSSKLLIIFAPDTNAWEEIGLYWEKTIHQSLRAGEGLTEVDYSTIMGFIAGASC